jgi:hypothetical protein
MATTTPNYGWTVPTSTDLVKDGATAIETLGDAIDASMNTALGTKKAGMVLLNTTSFSAVASVSLPASTFTSTYDNYRIVFTNIIGSANVILGLRWRKAGVDNTSNIYYGSCGIITWAGVSASGISSAPSTRAPIQNLATTFGQLSFDVAQPLTRPMVSGTGMAAGPEDRGQFFSAFINGSDTFDSATFFPASGTITGSVSVYGYNK